MAGSASHAARILLGIGLSLVLAQSVHADDPPALATDAQRALHASTMADEQWKSDADSAKAAFNQDDVLIQNYLEARKRGEAMLDDPALMPEAVENTIAPFEDEVRQITEQSVPKVESIIDQLVGGDPTVQSILEASSANRPDAAPLPKYILAVSRSMGEGAIQKALAIGREHPDMVIVFRGVLPGEKVQDLIAYLVRLNPPKEGEALANVVIDPTVFRDNGVTVAPTLLRIDEGRQVLLQARGVANPVWIEDRLARGERGDLGKNGETSEVSEEDIIEVMKRQLAAAKPEERAKRALENYWSYQKWNSLPTATRDRTREVDPTVVIPDGIYGPDGTVIAYPGQRLNPFDAIPFTMTVVVIDGRDPVQVAFARQKVVELDGKQVVVVTTEINPDKGWENFKDLVTRVGRMVYVLPPEMVERFQLEHVPCTVEGGDRVLIVREFALDAERERASQSAKATTKEGDDDAGRKQKVG